MPAENDLRRVEVSCHSGLCRLGIQSSQANQRRPTNSASVHITSRTAVGKLGRFSTTSEKSLRHCASGEMVSTHLRLRIVPGIPANSWSLGPPECQEAAHAI